MPLVNTVTEDDDNYSLSSETNSDDDSDESYCHTHRSCSRYASCNRNKHQHSSIDSNTSINLSSKTKPLKGDLRSVNNQLKHRQKYDGTKWRRICSHPNCLIYLNGGIFYEKWLCRKHYLLTITKDIANESNNSIIKKPKTQEARRLNTPQSNITSEHHKRGDIIMNTDGTRQKYTGRIWRPVCKYNNCTSFVVLHGYCHRHDVEMRKKSEIISLLNDSPQPSQSQITRSIVPPITKPKKGDIQLVRQQWNGTKWYSLCQHPTRNCTRRSTGLKFRNLCDAHYKEYLEEQKNLKLSSSKFKRKKIIHDDIIPSRNSTDEQIVRISCQTEHYAQTDVTCPLDSVDLRQGCILIDDEHNDSYECESPQLMVHIKKEEEDFLINKRKLTFDINSLPINCKLELTKIEI